jgi:hypothetical protein
VTMTHCDFGVKIRFTFLLFFTFLCVGVFTKFVGIIDGRKLRRQL